MVKFDKEKHKYYNDKGEEYISVSTLVNLCKPKFDSDYWSKYKAIEKYCKNYLADGENAFKRFKSKVTKENINELYSLCNNNIINSLRIEILTEWDKKRNDACEKGTAFHENKEKEIIGDVGVMTESGFLPHTIPNEDLQLTPGIYTEVRLWSHKYKIAGTTDKIILYPDFKTFDIDDHKTNKKIDLRGFQNKNGFYEKLNYPLNHLENCNYIIYSLQISIYAFLLEQFGYKLKTSKFTHYQDILDLSGNIIEVKETPYYIKYLKEDVIKLITWYNETQRRKIL